MKDPKRPRLTLAAAPATALSNCDRSSCAEAQSSAFWPYCSQSCAVEKAWEAVAAIERSIDNLDMPLQELLRLDRILDGCPFGDAAGKLQQIIGAVLTIIDDSQRELAKSAVDFTHGATAFTDALGPLIVGADDVVRQANPEWMKLPETWAAARDPKWQRGAMGGAFIQHWLSYNKFHMAEDVILVVYRSTWLRDTDPMYAPVAELLAAGHEVLFRATSQDKDMIFGHGELTIYALTQPQRGRMPGAR